MDILKYWRNSLADADRLNSDFEKRKPSGLQIKYDQLVQGKIPIDIVNQLILKFSDKKKEMYDVLFCPIILYVKTTHGSRIKSSLPVSMVPLWIPASMTKEGILKPHARYLPWLCREYLEPCESEIEPLGTVQEVDRFLSSRSTKLEHWKEYIHFASQMLLDVSGMSIEEFSHNQYERSDEVYLLSNDLIIGASRSIQDLYEYIQRDSLQNDLLLLNKFSQYSNIQTNQTFSGIDNEILATTHLGQMSNQFSLSESQRIAMHHTTLLNTGDLLAINGPPGTGKTTLLQSIVATAVIKHALEKIEPPIIVVSSTNNNAVTNVIESFGKINEVNGHPLNGRWISEITSYGAYLKSSSKKEETANNWLDVHKNHMGGSGFFDRLENSEYIEKCSKEYLAYCSTFIGYEVSKIEQAVEILHIELRSKVDQIQQIIQTEINYNILKSNFKKKYPFGMEELITTLEEKRQFEVKQLEVKRTLYKKWNQFLIEEDWWITLLVRLPVLKHIALRKKDLRYQRFCFDNHISNLKNEDELSQWLNEENESASKAVQHCEMQIAEVKQDIKELQDMQQNWENCMSTLSKNGDESYLDALDHTLRYDAFKLAVHYWEGRWILETEAMLLDSTYKRNNGKQGVELLWRRLAKLTPCFVSTLYMLPNFFSAYLGKVVPLYNFIDILIIDEAGQVVPEVAGASFALAKKAVVVGDTLQIPPVWNIPLSIDIGNTQNHGITQTIEDYEKIRTHGSFAADGSVMRMAKNLSRFRDSEADGGLWLTEHRRCVPEIIQYCNDLAYHGKLLPKRASMDSYFLPHMGYAHIPGIAQTRGGSLENELEAEIIVSWIDRNKDKILNHYYNDGITSMKDIIAIVTPFTSQKNLLIKKLKKMGMGDIKAGTVHTLQGDERPIVIFSPVYDSNSSSSYFYDQGVSMLNVAVSRAKDSFLVFGDMGTFRPNTTTPSGILAKYLFKSEENEIKNIDLENYYNTKYGIPIEHLHKLEDHRNILRDCIRTANHEVHIVSPFLSVVAIKADNLEEFFSEAIQRGVKIYVYTDENLNCNNKQPKINYLKAKEVLNKLGVELFLMSRVHSKTLWMDSDVLIEGSFNWLSAVRESNNEWCRHETSLVYRGSEVNDMLIKLKEELEKRKIILSIS